MGWRRRAVAAATASLTAAGCGAPEATPNGPTAPQGVWLGIDLHLHSDHSDDAADNPIAALVDVARARGLDALTITDHDNHVDGAITTWDDPALDVDDLLVVYGVEWTTARGHANLFAAAPWDHLPVYATRDADGAAFIAEAHRQGLHVSPNHPLNGDPWELGLDLDIDSLEVWNALFTFPTDNAPSLALWDAQIARGRRLPGRGGSDAHHQTGLEALGLNVGNPTTWVFAAERSVPALLDGLGAGRVSIGYDPRGERVVLRADADGDGVFEAMEGDVLPATGAPVAFRVDLEQPQPGGSWTLTVVRNGEVWRTETLTTPSWSFTDTPPAGAAWYRVEVRGTLPEAPEVARGLYGDLIGLTNPIYVGFDG